jgi:hypothetical protein
MEGGEMPEPVNNKVLALIPKVKGPPNLMQHRPISLCNVLYKIASTILSLRLRTVLEEIISEEQSTFVSGRLITENVITTFETINYLKKNKRKSVACVIN